MSNQIANEKLADRLERVGPTNIARLSKMDLDLIIPALRQPAVSEEEIARAICCAGKCKTPDCLWMGHAKFGAKAVLALLNRPQRMWEGERETHPPRTDNPDGYQGSIHLAPRLNQWPYGEF